MICLICRCQLFSDFHSSHATWLQHDWHKQIRAIQGNSLNARSSKKSDNAYCASTEKPFPNVYKLKDSPTMQQLHVALQIYSTNKNTNRCNNSCQSAPTSFGRAMEILYFSSYFVGGKEYLLGRF